MLSKKTRYAFRALSYLAENYAVGPILISEISKVKKANLLESKKGKGGGYFLKLSPKKINLATVIRVINGPIALLPCVSLNFYEKCEDCDEEICGIRKVMTITRDATLKVLEKKTLHDIVFASA